MPAAQMIRSPPTPGRAKAASADSDTGARTAFTVFSRSDSAVVGTTLSAAIGADVAEQWRARNRDSGLDRRRHREQWRHSRSRRGGDQPDTKAVADRSDRRR